MHISILPVLSGRLFYLFFLEMLFNLILAVNWFTQNFFWALTFVPNVNWFHFPNHQLFVLDSDKSCDDRKNGEKTHLFFVIHETEEKKALKSSFWWKSIHPISKELYCSNCDCLISICPIYRDDYILIAYFPNHQKGNRIEMHRTFNK